MKAKYFIKKNIWHLTLGALVLFAACDDPLELPPEEEIPPTRINVADIIVDPKAPAPSDTVLLTAVITSNGTNEGDFPVIRWTVEAGTLLETDKNTVRWVAPGASDVYEVAVAASNSVSSSNRSRTTFVGESDEIWGDGGEIHLMANETDIVFVRPPLNQSPLLGVNVRQLIAGSEVDPVPTQRLGFGHTFDDGLDRSVFISLNFNPIPAGPSVDVFANDHGAGTWEQITTDGVADPVQFRRDVYTFPSFDPNADRLAIQGLSPAVALGGIDTTDIYVHDFNTSTNTAVTGSHGAFRNNYLPTFSTDGNWLVFISDRSGPTVWEIWALPINGGVVETDSAMVRQFTDTGGVIADGTPLEFAQQQGTFPALAWSPTMSTLAIAAADGGLRLMSTTGSGATVTEIPAVGTPSDMFWTADGTEWIVQSGRRVFSVDGATAAFELLYEREADQFTDMTITPDKNWIVYRVTRSGSTWLEILNVATADQEPVVITKSTPVATAYSDYKATMSTRCVISSTRNLFFLQFDSATDARPSIRSLDLGGLTN